jgi:hypothetical protein
MAKCSHDQIELRAYQLWVERGQPEDTSEIDWLQAEAELRAAEPRSSKVARRLGAVLGSMVSTVMAARAFLFQRRSQIPSTT